MAETKEKHDGKVNESLFNFETTFQPGCHKTWKTKK